MMQVLAHMTLGLSLALLKGEVSLQLVKSFSICIVVCYYI